MKTDVWELKMCLKEKWSVTWRQKTNQANSMSLTCIAEDRPLFWDTITISFISCKDAK